MRRLLGGSCLLATFLLVSGAAVTGQDKKDSPKGALPANYGKLGLSDEQKAKIHAISAEYKAKIDSLSGQVKELQVKRKKEQEAVLTATQIELLRKLQTGETGGDKKPDTKKPTDGDKKPNEK